MINQKANKELLNVLILLVQKYPYLRLSQILIAFEFVTENSYEEPELTLERVRKRVKEYE